MSRKEVPSVVIRRLPRYYRYLGDLLNADIKRISSGALSKKMNVTASQIRQDFNYFGGFGQQGYGYNVEYLYKEIGEILGIYEGHTTIIIGAGNLGKALANYGGFEKRGFKLIGIFDNSPEKIGKNVNNIEVMSIDDLEEFLDNNKVDIAILTVPKLEAENIASRLSVKGVKGLLNFCYTDIKTENNIAIENVHLSDHLMTLSYNIKNQE